MEELMQNLKLQVIEQLNLEDVEADEIDVNEALFGDGLGLDSIDALELGLEIRKKYGVRINAEKDDVKTIFSSVSALAIFIESTQESNA